MALDKMTSSAGLNSIKPTDAPQKGSASTAQSALDGADFKRALEQVAGEVGGKAEAQSVGAKALGAELGKTGAPANAPALKFSNHAIERMRSRGIAFAPEQMQSIQNAVTKAAAKGSKDTLVLAGENALIVSVKNNTVVTVMDRATMKDNVFTNIDSTVVI
jgi:flagellar operon protein